jgi:hypothetical protein
MERMVASRSNSVNEAVSLSKSQLVRWFCGASLRGVLRVLSMRGRPARAERVVLVLVETVVGVRWSLRSPHKRCRYSCRRDQ